MRTGGGAGGHAPALARRGTRVASLGRMAARRIHGEPGGDDLSYRDRPFESFGQQGFALPDHEADPLDFRRGATTIDVAGGTRGTFGAHGPRNWRRADVRIHDDVCRSLAVDGHVDATDVEVIVHNGEVFLTGSVPDRAQRVRAEALAERVRGVIDVVNRLHAPRRPKEG